MFTTVCKESPLSDTLQQVCCKDNPIFQVQHYEHILT